jgi:methylated-DNA-[protein]-cysteine S-methyltransferase
MSATATPAPATTYLLVETPVGDLVIGGDDDHLTHLLLPDPVRAVPGAQRSGHVVDGGLPAAVAAARQQLDEYFAGARRAFDLPLAPTGTDFQRQVWFALADIPYGETLSYAELAARVGRPRAWRAVGQANSANPLPIILPCHRVVASGGGIGGYRGGLGLKRQLLALEQAHRP